MPLFSMPITDHRRNTNAPPLSTTTTPQQTSTAPASPLLRIYRAANLTTISFFKRLLQPSASTKMPDKYPAPDSFDLTKTDAEWAAELTPAEYNVIRNKVRCC